MFFFFVHPMALPPSFSWNKKLCGSRNLMCVVFQHICSICNSLVELIDLKFVPITDSLAESRSYSASAGTKDEILTLKSRLSVVQRPGCSPEVATQRAYNSIQWCLCYLFPEARLLGWIISSVLQYPLQHPRLLTLLFWNLYRGF